MYGYDSGEAEAVEAAGVIRPLGIAEIERTVGEGDVRQWSPNRAGQIGAGFHHDRKIVCAGDVEAKLIVLHAKAAVADLDQGVPQHSRNTCIGGEYIPAGGALQIIGCRVVVRIENRRISVRSVAQEKDFGQAGAKIKRRSPYVGDAVGNRDASQAVVGRKRVIPYFGDAAWNCDPSQAEAATEHVIPDAGDAVGDRRAGQIDARTESSVPNAIYPRISNST